MCHHAAKNWTKCVCLHVCHFCCFQQISQKLGVALCGAMWSYPKIWKNNGFPNFCCLLLLFSAIKKKKQAWRYTDVSQNRKKQVFQQNVIALCGVAPRLQLSANVKQLWRYMVYPQMPKTKVFSMLFLLFSAHVQKILLELCGGCPALQNDHV